MEVCSFRSIPSYLHSGDKPTLEVDDDDYLFLRHRKTDDKYIAEICREFKLFHQSVNSHKLNSAQGAPDDVLYDTTNGNRFDSEVYTYAVLDCASLLTIDTPNENVDELRRAGKKIDSTEFDVFSFVVSHKPVPCNYPHCEIHLTKNGHITAEQPGRAFRRLIRVKLAEIAHKNKDIEL